MKKRNDVISKILYEKQVIHFTVFGHISELRQIVILVCTQVTKLLTLLYFSNFTICARNL